MSLWKWQEIQGVLWEVIDLLLVETKLNVSEVHGIGLFAVSDIPEGTVVWKFHPDTTTIYSKKQWETIQETVPQLAFDNMARFAYLRGEVWMLNLDDSRFMNHSKSPTLGYDTTLETCYALRNISAGEELTVNYFTFCGDIDPTYMI